MNTQILLFIPIAYLAGMSIPLLTADIKTHRLPNKYLLPVFPIWLICSITYVVLSGDWWNALLMPLLLGVAYLLIGLVANYFDLIGMGDVKLIVAMTLSLSWKTLLVLLVPIVSIVSLLLFVIIAGLVGKNLYDKRITLAPALYAGYFILFGILFL